MNTPAPTADYKNLVDLMALLSEATARMGELENDLQQSWLDLVDARRKDYTTLQAAISTSEAAIEAAASLNPQWFAKVKSLKTPYGTVAFRSTKKLEVKNEEVSILLLEQLGQDGLPFLRTTKVLNIEALENLDDNELSRLRIKRITTNACKITPSKIDLGKTVATVTKGDAQ